MFHPTSISSRTSSTAISQLSPSLHRHANPVREDSSVEPRALRPARWPSGFRDYSASPTRRLPRSLTAPASSFASLLQPVSFDSDLSSPFIDPRPVQLSPGLSASRRDALPHPKALRPQPPPLHSDLSAASTRAENEPLAVRDLRRVTAPPALMDPWKYDRLLKRQRERERDPRKRIIKTMSSSSVVTDRTQTGPDAFALQSHPRRWRVPNRPGAVERKFSRRRWFLRPDIPPPRIPDRFYDSIDDRDEETRSRKENSVTSALTAESDVQEENNRTRWRSQSEAIPNRRSSFVTGKEKFISIWDRIRHRRRTQHPNRNRPEERPKTPLRDPRRTSKDRTERRAGRFLLFRSVER